jgi:hypothetical protein
MYVCVYACMCVYMYILKVKYRETFVTQRRHIQLDEKEGDVLCLYVCMYVSSRRRIYGKAYVAQGRHTQLDEKEGDSLCMCVCVCMYVYMCVDICVQD